MNKDEDKAATLLNSDKSTESLTEIFVLKKEYFELSQETKLRGLGLLQNFVNDQFQELKCDEVINVLNKMIENCKPIKYEDLDTLMYEKKKGLLEKIEKEDDRIGLRLVDMKDKESGFCTSYLAFIATMTDILVGKRLAFKIDDDNEFVTGVCWYQSPVKADGGEKNGV